MSLAALRQRDRDVTPTLHDWVQQPDLSARLVHIGSQYLHGIQAPAADSLVLEHESIKSVSPPSLHSCCTEATPTETSVSTGLAGHLAGYPLLEEGHEGVLEMPHGNGRTPVFECAFWFLDCAYISHNQEEWERHCLSHFRGEEPPLKVQCPLCDWTAHACEGGGHAAWAARMHHVASAHVMYGQTLRTSRPDFALFEYLWQRRLIDAEDLKELKAGNHNLTRPPGNFVEMGGARRERGRPHRTQHVRMTRQS
ncbi:hypothetical protein PSV08DRAFT_281760 [Bipolaris maydis]|uniref:uncharacterized protein n=1 Tax=Cochliobolus heterostrophus TaxID=5016 RepID=UPI0024D62999|nr:hypothetical protein J3E73DRAFT_290506 [Bipolaris maydis]KAJ5063341.1 hypothetical protein J3E74DRAFT_317508 [Bipolaris maydis]KAJ6272733.1 hypothetical protein PSV08DRAFT_281760 [Bipolaris maydis]